MKMNLKKHLMNTYKDILQINEIETGDGWFFIINELLKNIKRYTKKKTVVVQIKEKFGKLRVYLSYQDEYLSGVINMAESMSGITCEECGKSNELVCLNSTGWLRTLCPCCVHPSKKEEYKQNRNMELIKIFYEE
jgi:hypothetical protein